MSGGLFKSISDVFRHASSNAQACDATGATRRLFNALSLMMSGTILVLKLRNLKNDKRASSAAA